MSTTKRWPAAATSRRAPTTTDALTAYSVHHSVTTPTSHGWSTESAPTGSLPC